MVRLSADMLDKIDALRAKHNPQPSRPEAIRQVLEATFRMMKDE
jgi:metal-responsive CopG/Arc/MetJ family transcriptional regulator